jgi:chromosomal replication initiator protein
MAGEFNGAGGDDFAKFRAALQRRLGENVVSSWLFDLQLEERADDMVVLSTESETRCDTIGRRFILPMTDAWNDEVSPIKRLRVVLRDAARRVDLLKPRPTQPSTLLDEILSPVDDRQTFEGFAVDDSNSLAFAAARQIFAQGAAPEIVYLNGPNGVGKTHLQFAIVNEHARVFGPSRCAYLTYNALKDSCVNAVFNNGMPALHRELLSRDIILVDDIHLLKSSPRTQAELLNLVTTALASRRCVVVAGEMTPSNLAKAGINQRLADRLAGGLSVALRPGDAAHRARVIRKRIEQSKAQCRFGDDAVDYVAQNFSQSLREAIGAYHQLLLQYGGIPMQVGYVEAERVLKPRLAEVRRTPTLEEAAAATAAAFNISVDELTGRAQHQRFARARHAFVTAAREGLKESFPRIASAIKRDHTTAMSGYNRAKAIRERDPKFAAVIAAIRETLGCPAEK